ncbi:MAG: DUF378 domain-containing protein [Deltaproteobacteria bacterium]|nr:DUF378 domain-containing protein [Deltaproteobacteria bacterium]
MSVVLLALAILGALNWGLVGLFNWNLLAAIFGGAVHSNAGAFTRAVYAVIGLAGVALIGWLPRLGEYPFEGARRTRSQVRPE